MDEQQKEIRVEALREASRHRLAKESGDDVVANAEKYFKFLQGEQGNDK